MTYQEFKDLCEANAQNDQWLFGEGWDIIQNHPEFSDRLIVEQLIKQFPQKETAK